MQLFNTAKYYEAHEVLEEYWNQLEPNAYKQRIQGIIQCTASLHLLQQKRIIGAQKVWQRAQKNFTNNMDNIGQDNIDLDKLIQDMYKIFNSFEGTNEINVKISLK